MNLVAAFFKLIRLPNLFFIVLTQFLFRFFVLPFVYGKPFGNFDSVKLSSPLFYLLVIASVCIAAAGYIINDYFDVNIDLINKPEKLVIDKYIKRRWAIVWHILLSATGFALSGYIGYKIRNIYIPVFNLAAIAALWFYSTTFKRKLLIGNILISLLTAWVILVLMFAEHEFTIGSPGNDWRRLLKVSFIYGGFAFIISLIREVIKDMEDVNGDVRYGCKTMPIVWGIPVSKVFTAVWMVVLIAGVGGIEVYIVQAGWLAAAIYGMAAIIIPLLWALRKLYKAEIQADFHRLSNAVKLIMLAGIISMIFFYFH
ncbi:MAG TPA: geranylgeranylglycerol-phosphate geranylgeranyltransferase [Chitinophagaceae bacterium]|nr:geranylgeranylglycerol-phosphate geranylgeranyltransferase [Chitinophagaceae bacterium]